MTIPKDVSSEISIDHSLVDPLIEIRCLLCLEVITAPYLIIRLGKWTIYADDGCWDQLEDMIETIRAAHDNSGKGIMH